jgi:hypothetical protein
MAAKRLHPTLHFYHRMKFQNIEYTPSLPTRSAYKTIPLFPIEFPNSINGDKMTPTASPMNENPSSKKRYKQI